MQFSHHPKFIQELEEFIEHHSGGNATANQTVDYIQNLMVKHFEQKSPMFTGKHLGKAEGFDGFLVYWVHLVIPNSGLSRTQVPKAYFYKGQENLSFLCLDSHLQNYKDAQLRKVAKTRLEEILEVTG